MPVPPLDVGSLVAEEWEASSSCGCETAPSSTTEHDEDPYAPAESLRLRIGEDIDWSDVVAAVLERDDSTKGAAANPKCAARRSAAVATRLTAAPRSSLSAPAPAAVAVVIGGKAAARARDHGRRRRRSSPCQLQLQIQLGGGRARRVFASSGPEASAEAAEPGSPKVSCLGGVRSQSLPRTAAEDGITGGRRWWAWLLVADVMFGCCWNGGGRRDDRTEAEGERSRVE